MAAGPLSLDAAQTGAALGMADLIAELRVAAREYQDGAIQAPARQMLAYPEGGVMLSMPATARDIGIHKLVNVNPDNRTRGLPTINGVVAVYNGHTGQQRLRLDGPTVTARRTAAVSMLGIATFLPHPPACVALIGSGAQADGHVHALAEVFPAVRTVILASSPAKAQDFVTRHRDLALALETGATVPDEADVVITLTGSATPIYRQPARPGRLLVGVGAFKPELAEIAPETVRASRLYVDDLIGARHEAGDLIQAGVEWSSVNSLATALAEGVGFEQPIFFKSVGCAAWDLAAARCALRTLQARRADV